MPDTPEELADQLEREADQLKVESERLGEHVDGTREDWARKRGDPAVPGAPPQAHPDEDEQPSSPATQAPPPEEGPSASEEVPEMEVGPPADMEEESR